MLRRCLLLSAVVALLSGCGPDPADTQVGDPDPSPTSSSSSSDPAAPSGSGEPVQLRVVVATSAAAPPDSVVQQQFDDLDCEAEPAPVTPAQPAAACDEEGVKYSLEPAAVVGGVASAVAGVPSGQVAWAVTLDLEPAAARALDDLSAELAGTGRQLAVVLDGVVLTAPTVESRITGGQLQITGSFTEEQATALADRLAS